MPDVREIASGIQFAGNPGAVNCGSVLLVEVGARPFVRVKLNCKKEVVAETGGRIER